MKKTGQEGVIIINYIGRRGGGTLDAYEMAKALVHAGQNVIPIIPGTIENRKLWEGIGFQRIVFLDSYTGVVSFVLRSIFFFSTARDIRQALQGVQVKAVYVPMVGFWTKKINSLFPETKKIMACHDPFPHSGKDRMIYSICSHMFDTADIVVVHAKRFVPYLQRKYKEVRYLPLGKHQMYRYVEGKKQIVSYEPDKINYLFFGRIDKYKGIDILLQAYHTVEKKYPRRTALYIIGNGDLTKYQRGLKKLESVHVINRWIRDEEVEGVFSGENLVVVCPYKDATQSGVILVSYDYGVPVIATDTGALGEQVLDGKTGFLIQKNNPRALAKAMGKFIDAPKMMEQMRKHIGAYLSEISWDKSAKMLVSMINGFIMPESTGRP